MSKIKVCILQNGLAWGGTDTFVVNLCQGLDKTKYDVTVINPDLRPEKMKREQDVLDAGCTLLRTSPLIGIKGKILHLVRLYNILKKGKFDVFQTNIDLFNGPQLLVAWLARIPIRCCHSHNTMQQKSLTQGLTISIRLYQRVMKWMCWSFSNRRTGCSEAAMEFLFSGKSWHQDKYPIVVNNGIDINRFRCHVDVRKKKETLGLKAKYNIITVGRLIPQKNPEFIAEVFSELCRKREDIDLVWVGIGEKEQRCRDILKRNKCIERVHFMGSRSDVNEILPCCNLFFMPSVFEGLGIVIIEAQAAGLQCLVSDAVPHEANCGAVKYMSLSLSTSEWVHTILEMLDGNVRLIADEREVQEFSIEHMVVQMEKIFRK